MIYVYHEIYQKSIIIIELQSFFQQLVDSSLFLDPVKIVLSPGEACRVSHLTPGWCSEWHDPNLNPSLNRVIIIPASTLTKIYRVTQSYPSGPPLSPLQVPFPPAVSMQTTPAPTIPYTLSHSVLVMMGRSSTILSTSLMPPALSDGLPQPIGVTRSPGSAVWPFCGRQAGLMLSRKETRSVRVLILTHHWMLSSLAVWWEPDHWQECWSPTEDESSHHRMWSPLDQVHCDLWCCELRPLYQTVLH